MIIKIKIIIIIIIIIIITIEVYNMINISWNYIKNKLFLLETVGLETGIWAALGKGQKYSEDCDISLLET